MAKIKGPGKIRRYTAELKLEAVKPARFEGRRRRPREPYNETGRGPQRV